MLNTPPPKLAFSVAETCAALGLGKTNVYKLIAAGEINTIRIGGRRLVPAASIQALLDGKPATFAERTSTSEDQKRKPRARGHAARGSDTSFLACLAERCQ